MAITSVLYYIVTLNTPAEELEGVWSSRLFLSFDIPFLLANLFKFFDGGHVPMLIGAALIAGMLICSCADCADGKLCPPLPDLRHDPADP